MFKHHTNSNHNKGFSLVEIMVGLVVGLVVTIVVVRMFSLFEGQKRSISGVADSQTNGSIALYNVMRDAQMAGFGSPLLDFVNQPLKCNPEPTIDHDKSGATPAIGLFPFVITDGGTVAGASDQIHIRYGYEYTPPTAANRRQANISGTTIEYPTNLGAPMEITDLTAGSQTTTGVGVYNNRGCQNDDVVLISMGPSCIFTRVTSTNAALDASPTRVRLANTAIPTLYLSGSMSCMGRWNQITYRVGGNNNELVRVGNTSDTVNNGIPDGVTATPNVADIVNIQAQYGISDVQTSNQVTNWVSATGAWAAPGVADRNRIKAVRVAIVARSGLLEKQNVTNPCTTAKGVVNNGPCAWDDATNALAGINTAYQAPRIDLSANADSTANANWQRYRYRVFETIIPIRNVAWARENLK